MRLSNWQLFIAMFAAVFVVAFAFTGVKWSHEQGSTVYMQSAGIRTPHEVRRIHVDGEINAVAFNPDGSLFAIISHYGSQVSVFDTSTWQTKAAFSRGNVGYSGNSLGFLRNGTLILTAPATPFAIPLDRRFSPDLGFGPSERFALETRIISAPDRVQHLPQLAGVIDAIVPGLHTATTFAVSSDGRLIAAANGGGIPILDARSGNRMALLVVSAAEDRPHDTVTSLAFSRDGKRLAAGTLRGNILLYDTTSWTLQRTIPADLNDGYRISALAFSLDGQRLASGRSKNVNLSSPSDVGTEIWRVANGGKMADLIGGTYELDGKANEAMVFSLAWSGDYLAVGDATSFHLWHVGDDKATPLIESKMALGTLCVAFSSLGLLATAQRDELVVYQ